MGRGEGRERVYKYSTVTHDAQLQPHSLLWTPNPYIQCLLNISPWMCQKHHRFSMSKLISYSLS